MLLRDQVYEDLKQRIISGDLAPGATLNLGDLAAELEVSRTPVREALRRLEDESYVETVASRWTRVAAVDLGDAERMYPIRWALEAVAVRVSPPFDADQIEAMRKANQRLRDALEKGAWAETSAADEEFHMALVAPCDNPELTQILKDIRQRLLRFAHFYWAETPIVERSPDEHDRVIELVAAGDHAGAAEAITAHWTNSLDRMREHQPPAPTSA